MGPGDPVRHRRRHREHRLGQRRHRRRHPSVRGRVDPALMAHRWTGCLPGGDSAADHRRLGWTTRRAKPGWPRDCRRAPRAGRRGTTCAVVYVLGDPVGSGPAGQAPQVLRGRGLRDALLLRLLAVDCALRGAVLVALAYGLWRYLRHCLRSGKCGCGCSGTVRLVAGRRPTLLGPVPSRSTVTLPRPHRRRINAPAGCRV